MDKIKFRDILPQKRKREADELGRGPSEMEGIPSDHFDFKDDGTAYIPLLAPIHPDVMIATRHEGYRKQMEKVAELAEIDITSLINVLAVWKNACEEFDCEEKTAKVVPSGHRSWVEERLPLLKLWLEENEDALLKD